MIRAYWMRSEISRRMILFLGGLLSFVLGVDGGALRATALTHKLFVATHGKDTNPGTAARPFASIARAQRAAREAQRAKPNQTIIVTIADGRYELTETLQFSSEDSGSSEENRVVYLAAPGAEVELSGGALIENWEPVSEHPGRWRAKVFDPQSASLQESRFEQLWVGGERAVRARSPNWWEFYLLRGVEETDVDDGTGRVRHTFRVDRDDLKSLEGLSPEELQDVQIMVYHKWDTTREFIESVDFESGIVTTLGRRMQSWNPMTEDCLFFFDNVAGAIDSPGEFFVSRDGWLTYQARDDRSPQEAGAAFARLPRLLEIRGSERQPVKHLSFVGLKFRHAELRIPEGGHPPNQAAMSSEATAVQIDHARDIRFEGCAVEQVGTTAFWFHANCRDCLVQKTRMFDLGVSGVRIGEGAIAEESLRTRGITIDNCIIQSGGRILPCAVGVWIGQSSENVITHCDIGDFFYTGVSVGWTWGYADSAAQRNQITFNHLHHLGYRILSDMGGVYTLGNSVGTRVANNVIHDVLSTRYGGWGLYPDEGSTGIIFENNLVYDVHDGCFHQHYGRDNIVRNNILAFSEEGQIAVTRPEPHRSFVFERNIVYWNQGTLLGYGGWQEGAIVEFDRNLYWRAGGEAFDFQGQSWEAWRAAGRDAKSLIADPRFRDPENRDFHLAEDSPALQLSFEPFDIDAAGVYGDEAWKELARQVEYPEPYVVPTR